MFSSQEKPQFEIQSTSDQQGYKLKWQGKSRVCCMGNVLIGPCKYWYVYLFMYILHICACVTWVLMREVLQRASHLFFYYLVWIYGFILIAIYLYTAFSDPGVLLRNKNYNHIKINRELIAFKHVDLDSTLHCSDQPKQKQKKSKKKIEILSTDEQIQQNSELVPKIYQRRYCETCNIYKPALASHCRYCDQCVMQFDHHCFFTNSCIGQRNKFTFVLFIESMKGLQALYTYGYLIWLWQLTYDFNISQDDSELIILTALVVIITYWYFVFRQEGNIFVFGLSALLFYPHLYQIYSYFGIYYILSLLALASGFCLTAMAQFQHNIYYFLVHFNQTLKERRFLSTPQDKNFFVPKQISRSQKKKNWWDFFLKPKYFESELKILQKKEDFNKRENVAYHNVNDMNTSTSIEV